MQLSELSFLWIIQTIIFLAEIVFFLFLLLRFRAWHIRVLQAKQNTKRHSGLDDLDDIASFDKEKVQDLLDNLATNIDLERGRRDSDKEFLTRQDSLLGNIAKALGLSVNSQAQAPFGFSPQAPSKPSKIQEDNFDDFEDDDFGDFDSSFDEGFSGLDATSASNTNNKSSFDSFEEEPKMQQNSFGDLNGKFSGEDFADDDHEGFESAEDMVGDNFDSFDDFDKIDESGNFKDAGDSDAWAKLDEIEPSPPPKAPKQQAQPKPKPAQKSVTEKASAQIKPDEFNEDLQATLDDLDEFDFSDLERELMQD